MASEMLETFSARRVDLYTDPGLIDDHRRLRIKESVGGWRLDPPRTLAGHGDRGIALAMSLYMARLQPYWGSAWPESPEPAARDLSVMHLRNLPEGIFLEDYPVRLDFKMAGNKPQEIKPEG